VFGSANRLSRLHLCGDLPAATGGDLNTKEKINASRVSDETKTFFSAGESFADGAMIELISGSSKPNLLLWKGRKANVGARVEHGGCTYEAPELDPILWRAMRLPAGYCDYGSARALFDGIRGLFQRQLGLSEPESRLLACFAISTWLADRLPSAPGLTISSVDEELGVNVLRLLGCVCRHPLMLAEVTPSSFRSLPMHLSPTLLLNQQVLRPNLERLFRASSFRGLYLPGIGGRVVNAYGAKAIFCGDDAADTLTDGMMHISVAPSELQPSALDEQVQNEIASQFQPRLLMYRLKNSGKVRERDVDVSKFTFATRQLARTVAECFPEDAQLAGKAVELLRPQDEEVRRERTRDVNCAIVEILWRIVHDKKQRAVSVNKLAGGVNALLRDRGEILQYSPETIGWKLRNNLKIPRHDNSLGRHVLLGRDTSQSVHRLAQAYDLPCAQNVETGCPDCNRVQVTVS
jgi:hypothetical protein